jgi:hypothetical protein
VAGRACFLTDWQDDLAGAGGETPLIMRWVNSVIYWPLPMWAFTAMYLALFACVLALWRWVPPRPGHSLFGGRRTRGYTAKDDL